MNLLIVAYLVVSGFVMVYWLLIVFTRSYHRRWGRSRVGVVVRLVPGFALTPPLLLLLAVRGWAASGGVRTPLAAWYRDYLLASATLTALAWVIASAVAVALTLVTGAGERVAELGPRVEVRNRVWRGIGLFADAYVIALVALVSSLYIKGYDLGDLLAYAVGPAPVFGVAQYALVRRLTDAVLEREDALERLDAAWVRLLQVSLPFLAILILLSNIK